MNRGSRSFRRPRTGLRKTATRSEFDTSGARSPTKILYSLVKLGGCCCWVDCWVGVVIGSDRVGGDAGTEEAQLKTKGLVELGMMTGVDEFVISPRTEAA